MIPCSLCWAVQSEGTISWGKFFLGLFKFQCRISTCIEFMSQSKRLIQFRLIKLAIRITILYNFHKTMPRIASITRVLITHICRSFLNFWLTWHQRHWHVQTAVRSRAAPAQGYVVHPMTLFSLHWWLQRYHLLWLGSSFSQLLFVTSAVKKRNSEIIFFIGMNKLHFSFNGQNDITKTAM